MKIQKLTAVLEASKKKKKKKNQQSASAKTFRLRIALLTENPLCKK
jgi:hypothetical protein